MMRSTTAGDRRWQRTALSAQPSDADAPFNQRMTETVQLQGEDESLGDRLDREFDAAVADLINMAVDRREHHAEMPRIGFDWLRDVIGDHFVAFLACAKSENAPAQKMGAASGREATSAAAT